MSIAAGIVVWLLFFEGVTTWGEHFPGQLAGLLAAFVGMFVGSLAPQFFRNGGEATQKIAMGA